MRLKHYQNELVNREANFNKMFNAKPKVGKLNLLNHFFFVDFT